MRTVNVKVKCGYRWHTIGFDGASLKFPFHCKDMSSLYRKVTLAEFGNEQCGCATFLNAWRKRELKNLPEPLRELAMDMHGLGYTPYRVARRKIGNRLTKRQRQTEAMVRDLLNGSEYDRVEGLGVIVSRTLASLGIRHKGDADSDFYAITCVSADVSSTEHTLGFSFGDERSHVKIEQTCLDPSAMVYDITILVPFEGVHADKDVFEERVRYITGVVQMLAFRTVVACVNRKMLMSDSENRKKRLGYRDEIGVRAVAFLEREGVLTFDEKLNKPVFIPEMDLGLRVIGVRAIKALASKGQDFEREVLRLGRLTQLWATKKEVTNVESHSSESTGGGNDDGAQKAPNQEVEAGKDGCNVAGGSAA